MSFNIERGLFKFDFIDHHAVLGISVNSDTKEVRKRYLKIARTLHPDSSKAESETEKKLANQLLSKLVNPAYEQLSRSNNRDYLVSLSHLGRRLAAEQGKIPVSSDAAKQLTKAGPNLDNLYKTLVHNLASNQYDAVDQVLNKIAEISEVNMVYLMLKGSKGEAIQGTGVKTPTSPAAGTGKPATGTATAGRSTTGAGGAAGKTATGAASGSFGGMSGAHTGNPLSDSGVSRVSEYIRRAEGYMSKNNFAAAVLELREALKLDQHNSRCHTLLGVSYLKQNQVTMAKVHINKALQLNPKEELALKSQRYLEGLAQKGGAKPKVQPQPERKQPDKSGGGGLFGGLFGGKKK
ncbi:MAG TPA: DnaJ domain-containing protein [Allocoleopsis sp.]